MPFGRVGGAITGANVRLTLPFRSSVTPQSLDIVKQITQKSAIEQVIAEVPGLRVLAPIAKSGMVIPKAYGTNRMTGYVFWLGNYNKTDHTIDFAMLLQEGYLKGIRRIWADNKGKVIYSAKSTEAIEGAAISASRFRKLRVYNGTADQVADPLMIAKEGDTPAYRDTGYVMIAGWRLDKSNYEIWPLSFETIASSTDDGIEEVEHEYYELYSGSTSCISCTSNTITALINFENEVWIGYAAGNVKSYNPVTETCTSRGAPSAGNRIEQFAVSDARGAGDELYCCTGAGNSVVRWNGTTWTTTGSPTGTAIEAIAARPGGYLYAIRGNRMYYYDGTWTLHPTVLSKTAASEGSGFYDSDRDIVYFCSNGGAGGVYAYAINAANGLSAAALSGSGNGYKFVMDDSNIYLVRTSPDSKVQYRAAGIGSWLTYASSCGNFPEAIFLFQDLLHVASREALGIELYRDNGSGTFTLINNNVATTGIIPDLIKDVRGNPYVATDCLYKFEDETA